MFSQPALKDLGNVFEALGRYTEAIKQYDEVIKKDPKDLEAYCRLSALYAEYGELDKAEEQSLKALQINPNYYWVYNCLGTIESAKGNYIKCIEYFQTCILKKPPTLGPPYNNIGEAYRLLGDYDKAIDYLHRAIDNKSSIAGYILGRVYLEIRDFKEAEKLLLQEEEKQKNKSNPKLYLAITNFYSNNYCKAEAYLNQAVSITNKFPTIENQFNKLVALVGLQKTTELEEHLSKIYFQYKATQYVLDNLRMDLELLAESLRSTLEIKELVKTIIKKLKETQL